MKKSVFQVLIVGMMWVLSSSIGSAATITMGDYNVSLGNTVNQEIMISGLGDNAAPSVGAFDIDISYDAAFLQFNNAIFGNELDVFGLGSFQDVFSTSGLVDLLEVSFDDVVDLEAHQTSSFTLATLIFEPLQTGFSTLGVSGIISDAVGNTLSVNFLSGSVAATSTVPEAPTVFLMALGLLGFFLAHQQKRRKFN